MEKLVQDLKNEFFNLPEAIEGARIPTGNTDGQETKSESAEELSVQERAVKVTARGPKRPSVHKVLPPQTA